MVQLDKKTNVILCLVIQLRETTSRIYKGKALRPIKVLRRAQKDEIITPGYGWFRHRSMRRSQRTVFLLNQEMKTPGSSWHKPPPKGFGCLWARR